MKNWYIGVFLVATVVALAGCGGGQAASDTTGAGETETYISAVLVASYPDALDASGQLALGTLQLEETGSAVTPEQAATLLPLWQALQGGVTAPAEVDAVLKQIEGTMTPQQLLAIAGMQLTQEDLQAWMQENDIRPGGVLSGTLEWQGDTPGPQGAPQAGFGGGPPDSGTVSPEMATRRAEFENMSDAEREAMRATMEASGGRPGGSGGRQGGRFGGGGGQFMILLNPLIELLTQRAAE